MVRGTREEILSSAAGLFATVGYKGTSLQAIAEAVGCAKATLLYHFDSKDAILAALLDPPVGELAALTATLDGLSAEAARDAAIDGFVDLVLEYRQEVALIFHELTYLFCTPAFANVKELSERLAVFLAGGLTDVASLLSVKVMMAGIAAVALDPENAADELRTSLIGVARRALVSGA